MRHQTIKKALSALTIVQTIEKVFVSQISPHGSQGRAKQVNNINKLTHTALTYLSLFRAFTLNKRKEVYSYTLRKLEGIIMLQADGLLRFHL